MSNELEVSGTEGLKHRLTGRGAGALRRKKSLRARWIVAGLKTRLLEPLRPGNAEGVGYIRFDEEEAGSAVSR